MPTQLATFRFRDLPSEIRNQIYRELLCTFAPRPTTITVGLTTFTEPAQALHEIDTAILRTNKTTYQEAYDVLVKTNRFVKVTSRPGLPLKLLLNGLLVPVVTSDMRTVNGFKGYVLAVHLDSPEPRPHAADNEGMFDASTVMILHRDLDLFCQSLVDGDAYMSGFNEKLRLLIFMAPVLTAHEASPSMREFFSLATQKVLLAPLQAELRGFKNVKIQGFVDKELSKVVQEHMSQDRWSDADQLLADFTAAKEQGSKLFQQRRVEEGCLCWQDAALDLDNTMASSSWPMLLERGGERFVSQLAALYFLVRLNIAHVMITAAQKPTRLNHEAMMASDSLNMAVKSLKQDHWKKGYKYRPSIQLLTKLQYRMALAIRLEDEPNTADRALRHIEGALRSQPGDAAIMKEKDNIVAWKRRGY